MSGSALTVRGAWMAPLVKNPTLGFSSGHDLMVCEMEPRVGICADRAEPAGDSLSLSLSLCPSPTHLLPLEINK